MKNLNYQKLNITQIVLWLMAIAAAFFLGWIIGSQAFIAREAGAHGGPPPNVTFCHCERPQEGQEAFQCQTFTLPEPAYESGHGQHENDYLGACIVPSVTPTPSPTPTEEPCEEECEPTVTPTPTPEVTETPVEEVRTPGPASAPPVCEGQAPTWAPSITRFFRVDSDTVGIEWTSVGTESYWVEYGFTEDNLPYSLVVNGLTTTVDTPSYNGSVWFRVAGYNCALGPFSLRVDP